MREERREEDNIHELLIRKVLCDIASVSDKIDLL